MVGIYLTISALLLVRSEQSVRLNAEMHDHLEHVAARLRAHIATKLGAASHVGEHCKEQKVTNVLEFAALMHATLDLFWTFKQSTVQPAVPYSIGLRHQKVTNRQGC